MAANGKKPLKSVFVRLTRPDGSPVYVNPRHVAEVTPVVITSDNPDDRIGRGVTCLVYVGEYEGTAREVMEPCEKVMQLFNALYLAVIS